MCIHADESKRTKAKEAGPGDKLVGMKLMIFIGILAGSTIGGWLGALIDHGNWLGGWSLLLNTTGALIGVWVGYKFGRYMGD